MLPQTPWLCAYWPVRKVERDGQQSEYETKLLSKVTPWSAISVFTFGMTRIDSTVWSSVMRTTTFGRTAEEDFDLPDEADAVERAHGGDPATRAARTIQRVEAAMPGSLPSEREDFVKGL